jgi:FlaA1/EpsC-like NDP-sugar epimerase
MKALPSEFFRSKEYFEVGCGRKELELFSAESICDYFSQKKILITGAGGTIGSAVARRLVESGAANVTFLDRDESALHALALSVSDKAASHNEKCIVADIKDEDGLREVFREVLPDIVIHAAALKHLVILERFPKEGFLTNIGGTLNLLTVSKEFGVSQFINVSTDKAALPTSFLGITKRIGEICTASFGNSNFKTSSVRFGNVFASRGSVIETFIHQIQNNIPVTLTELNVDRFFMSHQEAANLILSATTLKSDALFIQDMGSPVKILDLIERLAQKLQHEFTIRIIGLQSGEKLSEDLFETKGSSTKFSTIFKLKAPFVSNINSILSGKLNPSSNIEARRNAVALLENLESNLS